MDHLAHLIVLVLPPAEPDPATFFHMIAGPELFALRTSHHVLDLDGAELRELVRALAELDDGLEAVRLRRVEVLSNQLGVRIEYLLTQRAGSVVLLFAHVVCSFR